MIHTAGISLNDLVVLMSVVIFTLRCVRVWNCWARVVIFYCVGLWVLYSLMPPSSGHKGHYNNITLRLICFWFFLAFFSLIISCVSQRGCWWWWWWWKRRRAPWLWWPFSWPQSTASFIPQRKILPVSFTATQPTKITLFFFVYFCIFARKTAVGTFKCIFFNAVNMKGNTNCLHYVIYNI